MPEKPPNLPEDMSDLINDPDSLRTREERIRGIVEDEELGRKLREPVDEDDIGRQEEKIYQIPRAERAEFCRKLLAEYQERCRRQIAVLEKVKDDPGKAELLDHWRDISAKMEKGDVSSYLAELEKRMKSQLSELYDVMEQLQQEENKAAKVGLNNRKENILQVINRLMKSERNLWLIDDTLEKGEQETIDNVLPELKKFANEKLTEAVKAEDEEEVKTWQLIAQSLEKGNTDMIYAELVGRAAELDLEIKQLKFQLEKPPEELSEEEKDQYQQMAVDWSKKVKLRTAMERLADRIDSLNN